LSLKGDRDSVPVVAHLSFEGDRESVPAVARLYELSKKSGQRDQGLKDFQDSYYIKPCKVQLRREGFQIFISTFSPQFLGDLRKKMIDNNDIL
jgi:hypothetical protein